MKNATFVFILTVMYCISIGFSLTVVTDNGSIIYYNDKLVGVVKNTNLTFSATFPGYLRVVKPGYLPFEKYITEDGTVTVKLDLPSYIQINIQPENATIFVDDVQQNATERKCTIAPGKHVLKFTAPGYVTKILEIEILPYEEKVLDVALKKTVTLYVNSDKKIDGVLFDSLVISLPAVLETVPGKHKIVLPENFVNDVQIIEIPAIDSHSVTIDTRQKFVLTISGRPENAYVEINKQIYKGPITLTLPEGVYDAKIFLQGYLDQKTQINLSKDETIYYVLKPYEEISVAEGLSNYKLEFDGFSSKKLTKRPYFLTIRDERNDVIWYGFSDGTLNKVPSTVPVIISKNYETILNGIQYKGPSILQVPRNEKIDIFSKGVKVGTCNITGPTVIDDEENCVVNIYAKEKLDVYWNGQYIGKTPIYLFTTKKGVHNVVFKNKVLEIAKFDYTVEQGKLNEIKVEY
ncbi:MAG: PEGA domain-containing protein [Fervidobacterium sp.]